MNSFFQVKRKAPTQRCEGLQNCLQHALRAHCQARLQPGTWYFAELAAIDSMTSLSHRLGTSALGGHSPANYFNIFDENAMVPPDALEAVKKVCFDGPLQRKWFCFKVLRLHPGLLKTGPQGSAGHIQSDELAVVVYRVERHGQELRILMDPVDHGHPFLWAPACPHLSIASLSKSLGEFQLEHCKACCCPGDLYLSLTVAHP